MDRYWENRYKSGRDSGEGSYGKSAEYKASIINNYINKLDIKTIGDYGCGDGNQISLLSGFELYHGYDISNFIVDSNIVKFEDKYNMFFYKNIIDLPECDLNMTLDVLYHICLISEYTTYLMNLFNKSKKYVLIYSTNRVEDFELTGDNDYAYHRRFKDWVEENILNFELVEKLDNPLYETNTVNFYLYKRNK